MLIGLFGAALPMYLTMTKIRHKTKHQKFILFLSPYKASQATFIYF